MCFSKVNFSLHQVAGIGSSQFLDSEVDFALWYPNQKRCSHHLVKVAICQKAILKLCWETGREWASQPMEENIISQSISKMLWKIFLQNVKNVFELDRSKMQKKTITFHFSDVRELFPLKYHVYQIRINFQQVYWPHIFRIRNNFLQAKYTST